MTIRLEKVGLKEGGPVISSDVVLGKPGQRVSNLGMSMIPSKDGVMLKGNRARMSQGGPGYQWKLELAALRVRTAGMLVSSHSWPHRSRNVQITITFYCRRYKATSMFMTDQYVHILDCHCFLTFPQ